MKQNKTINFWKNPVVLFILAGIGYWIYTYHLEHALGFLPYSILLLCPLMHIFMHGGHSHGEHTGATAPPHHKNKTKENNNAR